MNLDDLRKSWREIQANGAGQGALESSQKMLARVEHFERTIVRRDLVEAFAALIVMLFFGGFLWRVPMPLTMQIGVVMILLSALEIVGILFWTRRRDALPGPEASLTEYAKAELLRLDRQIHLLRNVTWWYSGPMLIGVAIFLAGVLFTITELPPLVWLSFAGAFASCLLAAGYIVFRINERAVVEKLLPLRADVVNFQALLVPPAETEQITRQNDEPPA